MNISAKVDVVMADSTPAPEPLEVEAQEPETADVAAEVQSIDPEPVQRISRRTGKTIQAGE